MKNYLILLAAAASFTFTSCGNDDDDVPTPPTRTELLTSKNWKMTANLESSSDTTGTVDLYAQMDACSQDDLLKFSADKKFVWDEGATKCDPTDPQEVMNGTWALTNNDNTLQLTLAGLGTGETEITELTTTKMTTRSVDIDQGVTTVTNTTYMAQ